MSTFEISLNGERIATEAATLQGLLLERGYELKSAFACAVNNSGVVFINNNTFCCAKVCNRKVFKLNAHFFRNNSATGKDSKVLEHSFSAVAKARGFNCNNL